MKKREKYATFTSLIEDLRKTLSKEQLKEVDIQFNEYLKKHKNYIKNLKEK